jgi:hypothetical protein
MSLAYAESFRAAVPPSFLRSLLRVVLDGCIRADEQVESYDQRFRVDGIQAHRRHAVEQGLAGLVLPAGFQSTVVRTPSTNYTKIFSDNVTLTAVTRAAMPERVPPYVYRKVLAEVNQVTIFDYIQRSAGVAVSPSKMYGLLVYGGEHSEKIAQLARIVFPTPTGRIPVRDSIDLLREHADLVAQYLPKDEVLEAQPRLRKKRAVRGA